MIWFKGKSSSESNPLVYSQKNKIFQLPFFFTKPYYKILQVILLDITHYFMIKTLNETDYIHSTCIAYIKLI